MTNSIVTVYDWLKSMGKVPGSIEGKLNPLAVNAPTYVLEELTEAVEAIGGGAVSVYIDALESTLARLKSINTVKAEPDRVGVRDGIADMLVTVFNISYGMGISPDRVACDFQDVMDSNKSKVCNSLHEAEATVKAYAEGTHPDKLGVKMDTKHTSYSPGKYVIERVSDGKILKSINYQPPRLSSI
jgi:hypothetical protein